MNVIKMAYINVYIEIILANLVTVTTPQKIFFEPDRNGVKKNKQKRINLFTQI